MGCPQEVSDDSDDKDSEKKVIVEPSPGEDEPVNEPVDEPAVEPSSDNNIKSVVIDNCFIDKSDFDGQEGYTILFPKDATTLKINIELFDDKATIEEVYGEATLESDGSFTTDIAFNLFDLEFKVTAENKEEKLYKLRFVNEIIMQMQM